MRGKIFFLAMLVIAPFLAPGLAPGLAPAKSSTLQAQEQDSLRVMQIEDYARWRSIVSVAISEDGDWMTYGYRHHRADDSLYVKKLDSGQEYAIPRGSEPAFSDDSRWVAYTISKTFEEAEKAEREYYLSLTGEERLEILRQLVARGNRDAPKGFKRVYRITKLKQG